MKISAMRTVLILSDGLENTLKNRSHFSWYLKDYSKWNKGKGDFKQNLEE